MCDREWRLVTWAAAALLFVAVLATLWAWRTNQRVDDARSSSTQAGYDAGFTDASTHTSEELDALRLRLGNSEGFRASAIYLSQAQQLGVAAAQQINGQQPDDLTSQIVNRYCGDQSTQSCLLTLTIGQHLALHAALHAAEAVCDDDVFTAWRDEADRIGLTLGVTVGEAADAARQLHVIVLSAQAAADECLAMSAFDDDDFAPLTPSSVIG